MKRRTAIAVASLAAALLAGGAVHAQTPAVKCPPKGAPERVEGQVLRVDTATNMVTIRAADGNTYDFQASPETLRDIKVGEKLSAKLRVPPNCK